MITLFKWSTNERGYVMCTIRVEFKEEFAAMGFVDHIDKVNKPRTRKAKKDDK